MLIDSPAVDRLVDAFRRLPGIGKRTAERLAMHVLSAPDDEALEIAEALREARARVRRCSICQNLTEQDPCRICADERRDAHVLCVVEHPTGAIAIERGGGFKGKYHVLHGVLNPLEGVGPDELGLGRLFRRVEEEGVREVIVATNTTAEGEATALFLSRQLTSDDVAVTRIAHGVPMGGGLEYADALTLSHALEGRKPL